jgi:hypothetical protein
MPLCVLRPPNSAFTRLVLEALTRVVLRCARRHVMPPTPQEWVFAGLNLLRLLLANRIAEFHTELELIPEQVR